MTDTAARTDVLRDAMHAAVTGDESLIEPVYAEDVTGWSPVMEVSSRDELTADLRGRSGAFSDIDLVLDPVEAVGDKLIAEWRVAATHTGVLALDETSKSSRPAAGSSCGACSSPSSRATASGACASTGTRSS
jgi:hypothetical protein